MKTTFEMKSGKMRVTDPCYDKKTWCSGVIENVLSGVWFAENIILDNEQTNGWGNRNGELIVWHSDYSPDSIIELTSIDVGVDSGQAGFFDDAEYPTGDTGEYGNTDTFYGKVCEGTAGQPKQQKRKIYGEADIKLLSEKIDADTLNSLSNLEITESVYDYLSIANVGFGVACHSGYGDGGYNCFVKRNSDGKVVAAKIVFIEDEPEDEMELDEAFDIIHKGIEDNILTDENKEALLSLINKRLN